MIEIFINLWPSLFYMNSLEGETLDLNIGHFFDMLRIAGFRLANGTVERGVYFSHDNKVAYAYRKEKINRYTISVFDLKDTTLPELEDDTPHKCDFDFLECFEENPLLGNRFR